MDEFYVDPARLIDHSALILAERRLAGELQEHLRRARNYSLGLFDGDYARAAAQADSMEYYFSCMSDSVVESGEVMERASMRVADALEAVSHEIDRLLD